LYCSEVDWIRECIAGYDTPITITGYFSNCNFTSTSNALPDDGVTAAKHVGAVLMSIIMSILILFLRQFICTPVGE
jgi:hypothetical protein